MHKTVGKWLALLLVMSVLVSLAGCGSAQETTSRIPSASNAQTPNAHGKTAVGQGAAVDGLPQGFPAEVQIYSGAQVIDADSFNGNNYTVLYSVNAGYDKIVDFYTDAFDLDGSGTGDGEAYYEGLDFGDIFIKGLTIEDTGDAVNVYMTMQDTRRDEDAEGYSGDGEKEEPTGGTAGSDVMTYETAEVVALDSSYPQDVVPLPEGAKFIGCSMVPGKRSGFVDLILPEDDFDTAVAFYTDSLGLSPKNSTTSVQEAASFKEEISGIKVAVLVSHLLGGGHDTLVQITVDEK